MPATGTVDVSMGGTDWHSVCLIRPGQQNVAVQITADSFMKIFDIVNRCLDAQAASEKTGVHTPTRKLRRTRSNPQKPRGPPKSREYYVNGKGRVFCEYKDVVTPPDGSRKRIKGSTNRRFVKHSPTKPNGGSSGPRPVAKKRASAGDSKRNRRTLSSAAAPQRDDDDDKSSSHDLFGGE